MTGIAGVDVYHPRTEWEQVGFRMASDFTRLPTAIKLGAVDQMVAHYTGAKDLPDGDPGEDLASVQGYLRAIERDYLTNRTEGGYIRKVDAVYFPGYHTGYSFAVDWLGGCWEIRGFDYLPAATNQHNGHTVAVLFLVDGAFPAPDAMWATARAIGRETRRRSGRADFQPQFTDHGSLTASSGTGTVTPCAGAGIRNQLPTQGNLDLDHDPEEPVTVRYFRLAADHPTVWATADDLTAVRLDGSTATARGVDIFNVPVIPDNEAARLTYNGGLPYASVR